MTKKAKTFKNNGIAIIFEYYRYNNNNIIVNVEVAKLPGLKNTTESIKDLEKFLGNSDNIRKIIRETIGEVKNDNLEDVVKLTLETWNKFINKEEKMFGEYFTNNPYKTNNEVNEYKVKKAILRVYDVNTGNIRNYLLKETNNKNNAYLLLWDIKYNTCSYLKIEKQLATNYRMPSSHVTTLNTEYAYDVFDDKYLGYLNIVVETKDHNTRTYVINNYHVQPKVLKLPDSFYKTPSVTEKIPEGNLSQLHTGNESIYGCKVRDDENTSATSYPIINLEGVISGTIDPNDKEYCVKFSLPELDITNTHEVLKDIRFTYSDITEEITVKTYYVVLGVAQKITDTNLKYFKQPKTYIISDPDIDETIIKDLYNIISKHSLEETTGYFLLNEDGVKEVPEYLLKDHKPDYFLTDGDKIFNIYKGKITVIKE